MKTDVRTLVIVDMHGYFGPRLQLSAGRQLIALHVRPNDIVGLAGGHSLGELAGVVGIKLPAGFCLVRPPDLHCNPIEWVPVGIPNRPEDECVWFRLLGLAPPRAHRDKQSRHKHGQDHERRSHRNPAPNGGATGVSPVPASEHPDMCRILQESSSSDSSLTT